MHPHVFLTALVSALLVVSGRAYIAQATSGIHVAPGTSVGELTPASNISSTTRSNDQVRTLALQPDGKLVVAGLSDGRAQNSFALARYQPDGSLDTSFGTDGKVITRIGTDDAEVTALALQADGKLVAAGRTYSATDPMKPTAFALVRYQPNARVDPSFGTDGIVPTPASLGPLGTVSAVALQADGKIVVLVRPYGTEDDFFLFRYLTNGGVDIGFGTEGRVTGAVGFHTEILALALQADGTLLVAGTEMKMIGAMGLVVPPGVTDFCPGPFGRKLVLARYTADGSLATTFGSGGVRIVDLTTFRAVRALAFQPDGKVVVAGDADCHFALARYYADGSPDTSFGTDGIASSHKGSAVLLTVMLQPDGKIVAAGVFYDDLLLVRYTADGRLDTSFGTNGTVTLQINETHTLAAQPDGKIVVAGAVYDADYDFALVRYDRDGNPDAHFGTGGTVTTNFATLTQVDHCETAVPPFPQLPRGYRGEGPPALRDAAAAVALQPDGKIVVAGTADYALALLRYQPDGALDPSFGKNGVVSTRISTYEKYADLASVLALQPDGKLVVAGATWLDAGYRFFLVRYHPDGRLDPNFGTHGIVTSSIGTGAAALALQTDGAVVAVIGASGYGTTASLVRFRSDGSLDPSFGSSGTISTGLIEVRSSVIQTDGKLVVPGFKILEVTKNAVKHAFVLVRYHRDGPVDPSFGVNGTLTLDTWQDTIHLSNFALQPDSKIVGSGVVPYPEDLQERAVLTRYYPDGRIDTDFGIGGKIAIPTTSLASARVHKPVALIPWYYCSGFCQIGLQSDGKIVAAGSPANSNITLSRYQSDGSLDSGFGDGGTVTTTVGSSGDILGALAFQSDGKIVIAGTCANARHTNISLVRYNPDGSLDSTFDRDGKVTTRIGSGLLGR